MAADANPGSKVEEADYYGLMGLPRSATAEQIKRAYRQLAMAWHPDMCDEPGTAERFVRLYAAYRCLVDPAARVAYDLTLPAPAASPAAAPGDGAEAGPEAEGAAAPWFTAPEPPPAEEFEPRRVVVGGGVAVRCVRWVPCRACDGTGETPGGDVCETCHGVGRVTRWSDVPVGATVWRRAMSAVRPYNRAPQPAGEGDSPGAARVLAVVALFCAVCGAILGVMAETHAGKANGGPAAVCMVLAASLVAIAVLPSVVRGTCRFVGGEFARVASARRRVGALWAARARRPARAVRVESHDLGCKRRRRRVPAPLLVILSAGAAVWGWLARVGGPAAPPPDVIGSPPVSAGSSADAASTDTGHADAWSADAGHCNPGPADARPAVTRPADAASREAQSTLPPPAGALPREAPWEFITVRLPFTPGPDPGWLVDQHGDDERAVAEFHCRLRFVNPADEVDLLTHIALHRLRGRRPEEAIPPGATAAESAALLRAYEVAEEAMAQALQDAYRRRPGIDPRVYGGPDFPEPRWMPVFSRFYGAARRGGAACEQVVGELVDPRMWFGRELAAMRAGREAERGVPPGGSTPPPGPTSASDHAPDRRRTTGGARGR